MVHYISLKEIRVKNISASGQSRYLFESTGIYQVTFQPWNEKITLAWTDSSFGPYSNVQQLAKISPAVK